MGLSVESSSLTYLFLDFLGFFLVFFRQMTADIRIPGVVIYKGFTTLYSFEFQKGSTEMSFGDFSKALLAEFPVSASADKKKPDALKITVCCAGRDIVVTAKV